MTFNSLRDFYPLWLAFQSSTYLENKDLFKFFNSHLMLKSPFSLVATNGLLVNCLKLFYYDHSVRTFFILLVYLRNTHLRDEFLASCRYLLIKSRHKGHYKYNSMVHLTNNTPDRYVLIKHKKDVFFIFLYDFFYIFYSERGLIIILS